MGKKDIKLGDVMLAQYIGGAESRKGKISCCGELGLGVEMGSFHCIYLNF